MRTRDDIDQGQLGRVEVLEFVDQDVPVSVLERVASRRVGEQVEDGLTDLVIERLHRVVALGVTEAPFHLVEWKA